MKKNKYFIFAILLLLLLISCKENTSKLNKEITTSKQIEWKSFVDDDIPHPTRFSFYDENGNYVAGLFNKNREIIFLTRESDGSDMIHQKKMIMVNGLIQFMKTIEEIKLLLDIPTVVL